MGWRPSGWAGSGLQALPLCLKRYGGPSPEPEVGRRNFRCVDGNFHLLLVCPCIRENSFNFRETFRAAGIHSVSFMWPVDLMLTSVNFSCGRVTFHQLSVQ